MADSKYANLPGIAHDQADVYETSDLPESEQFPNYSEDESDSIERLHISASEAFNKFKGKHIVTKGVDFSDRISRKPRTGYSEVFGVWELPGEGEKETPIQKYQRLQCEIKELYDEVNDLKEKAKEEKERKSAVDIIAQVEEAGKQLNILKLDETLGTDLVATLTDPQGTRLKQLVHQIEEFKSIGSAEKSSDKPENLPEEKATGFLKYEMMFYPEKAKMQEAARVAQLEQRLARLEHVIGTNDDKFAKFSQNLKSQGVIEAVQQLAAKSALLDSSQVEIMEGRIATLSHRMDTVAQKKSSLPVDTEREQKINEMYEIFKKTEPLAQVLPQTVDRMIALNSIHRRAADFNKSLTQLEELHSQIKNSLENNKSLLEGIQDSFATNMQVIHKNISGLEERIQKLNK
ncbi:dynactin subunit 2 [Chelonus insularis]|uniref:dynactin subunit 2 n=1 Tax=Chelonus insularis TaxID=460826 RepID=UPI00158F372B|nr:dynactin subunit 2 [Chelonus insularis]